MPGGGIKLGITPNSARPICLDLTRLIRRSGRVFTGVDRVEWAYLEWCLTLDREVYGLVRTALGYVLLDRLGLSEIHDRTRAADWPAPGLLSRLSPNLSIERRGAETALRTFAIARCTPLGLRRMLAKVLPSNVLYLNTGHSNLTARVFTAFKSLADAQSVALIHDMIPLTHPEFQRDGTVKAFERKMQVVSQYADGLICNSEQTQKDVETFMGMMGRVPLSVVAHLGVESPIVGAEAPDIPRPYVITVGTIEPRKNHALLLDIWQDWPSEQSPPHLVICGGRGWNNEDVFARIEALKAKGAPITELNGIDDATMLKLVQGASAALFPSFAEGYGLPQIEAAQLGVPLICGDLDIYGEVLGELPVYVDVNDAYSWRNAIEKTVQPDAEGRDRAERYKSEFRVPSWDSHFNLVLKHFG